MVQFRFRSYPVWCAVLLLLMGTLAGVAPRPAAADVTAVSGSACGYFAEVSLFGGPSNRRGCGQPANAPATNASPSVTLPATGSANPITATDEDGAVAEYGPAKIFAGQWPENAPQPPPSGPINVSTQGTLGPNGSVTSSASVTMPRGVGPGPVIADGVSSTCTASESGVSASTTITNGKLETKYDPNTQLPTQVEDVPANPPVNYTRTGTIDHVGDSFRVVYNEQVTEADGSITVNAVHMYLLGPTAVGDLVIAQSRCGVTATAATTTTTQAGATTTTQAGATTTTQAGATTTTQAGATTTTQAPGTTTTQSQATTTTSGSGATTTTAAGGGGSSGTVSGGACGYYALVSLFGGPSNRRGCDQPAGAPATNASPSVTLPEAGSATPVTATDEDGATAEYGPAKIFAGQYPPDPNASAPPSGPITVSTQGVPGGEVTSSASITLPRGVGPGPVVADGVRSTCTASGSGATGSTTITNGKLETKYDTSSQEPIAVEDVPANPPVNYTRTGTIDHVGDSFRVVYNEHITEADGSITVNAVHMYLLGPTAVGDLVIAQSRCGRGGGGGGGGGSGTGSGGGGAAATARTGGVASTGANVLRTVALAMLMVVAGAHVRVWAPRLLWVEAAGGGGRRRRTWPARPSVHLPRRPRKRPWG
ncbi:MAG: hypothetical protein M3203_16130 [Actinomycetota bacterium]|nr:hypothetical protein [Actinomycetota bacterium]